MQTSGVPRDLPCECEAVWRFLRLQSKAHGRIGGEQFWARLGCPRVETFAVLAATLKFESRRKRRPRRFRATCRAEDKEIYSIVCALRQFCFFAVNGILACLFAKKVSFASRLHSGFAGFQAGEHCSVARNRIGWKGCGSGPVSIRNEFVSSTRQQYSRSRCIKRLNRVVALMQNCDGLQRRAAKNKIGTLLPDHNRRRIRVR